MPDMCRICRKSVSTDDIRIQWSSCQTFFHGSCVCMKANDISYIVDNNESWFCATCTQDTRVLRSNSAGSLSVPARKAVVQTVTADQFSQIMSTLGSVAADIASIKSSHENLLADVACIKSAQQDIVAEMARCSATLGVHSETLRRHADLIDDCKVNITAISSSNASVMKDVEKLSSEVAEIKSRIPGGSSLQSSGEDITREIAERLRRANNLIIRRLPEISGSDGDSTSEYDRACEVLRAVDPESVSSVSSVTRVGRRSNSGRPRPVKVCFANSSVALRVLRSKEKLRESDFKEIHIHDDMTPCQQKQLAQLRSELKGLHDGGDPNWTIKYVKGVPTIVAVMSKK